LNKEREPEVKQRILESKTKEEEEEESDGSWNEWQRKEQG
jgi:hypothetical protein